jgi:hypothetical protein
MGAVINERPSLFHGIIAQVPFVDTLTTMLDESIPLTTGEFEEWGIRRMKPTITTSNAIVRTIMSAPMTIPICWLPQGCMTPGAILGTCQMGRETARI